MSRTEPIRDVVLKLRSSTISYSEYSDDSDENIEDVDIFKILSEETVKYDVLDALPPTPQCPVTRSQSRLSVSSAVSSLPTTPQKIGGPSKELTNVSPIGKLNLGNDAAGSGKRISRRRTDKQICDKLGINLDDSEFQEIEGEDDDDNRVPVDNIIEDLLDLGLGKTRAPGGMKEITVEEENLHRQFAKLRTKVPLEISGDGRCTVLNEDVTTVRKTLQSMTALISVLEKTRDRLISEDKDLVFTPPPVVTKKKSKLPRSQKKS